LEIINLISSFSKHNNKSVEKFNRIWTLSTNNLFWDSYIHFLRVKNEHFLGYPLKQAIELVLKMNLITLYYFYSH
jgi:hypothetical protein